MTTRRSGCAPAADITEAEYENFYKSISKARSCFSRLPEQGCSLHVEAVAALQHAMLNLLTPPCHYTPLLTQFAKLGHHPPQLKHR